MTYTTESQIHARLTKAALPEFKRAGLHPTAAQVEAESFAYAAAELLRERLEEALNG